MKIIQICGTNGVGKTTLIKRLLQNASRFARYWIDVSGKHNEYWSNGDVVVIGKYNESNCCGVDSCGYSVDTFLKTLKKIITDMNPRVILFEDMRFGASLAFKQRLLGIASMIGCRYVLLNLVSSPEIACNRVYDRSGNMDADYDSIISRQQRVIRSGRKIHESGAQVIYYDTGVNDPDSTLELLIKIIGGDKGDGD